MKCQICCRLVTLADRIGRAGGARAGLLSAYYVDVRRRGRGADMPWPMEIGSPRSRPRPAVARWPGSDIDAHLIGAYQEIPPTGRARQQAGR